jgi:hypothetical protein
MCLRTAVLDYNTVPCISILPSPGTWNIHPTVGARCVIVFSDVDRYVISKNYWIPLSTYFRYSYDSGKFRQVYRELFFRKVGYIKHNVSWIIE